MPSTWSRCRSASHPLAPAPVPRRISPRMTTEQFRRPIVVQQPSSNTVDAGVERSYAGTALADPTQGLAWENRELVRDRLPGPRPRPRRRDRRGVPRGRPLAAGPATRGPDHDRPELDQCAPGDDARRPQPGPGPRSPARLPRRSRLAGPPGTSDRRVAGRGARGSVDGERRIIWNTRSIRTRQDGRHLGRPADRDRPAPALERPVDTRRAADPRPWGGLRVAREVGGGHRPRGARHRSPGHRAGPATFPADAARHARRGRHRSPRPGAAPRACRGDRAGTGGRRHRRRPGSRCPRDRTLRLGTDSSDRGRRRRSAECLREGPGHARRAAGCGPDGPAAGAGRRRCAARGPAGLRPAVGAGRPGPGGGRPRGGGRREGGAAWRVPRGDRHRRLARGRRGGDPRLDGRDQPGEHRSPDRAADRRRGHGRAAGSAPRAGAPGRRGGCRTDHRPDGRGCVPEGSRGAGEVRGAGERLPPGGAIRGHGSVRGGVADRDRHRHGGPRVRTGEPRPVAGDRPRAPGRPRQPRPARGRARRERPGGDRDLAAPDRRPRRRDRGPRDRGRLPGPARRRSVLGAVHARERREIVGALSSLGFRFDGLGGFADDRVPAPRDLIARRRATRASTACGSASGRGRRTSRRCTPVRRSRPTSGSSDEAGDLEPRARWSTPSAAAPRSSRTIWNAWGRVRPALLATD